AAGDPDARAARRFRRRRRLDMRRGRGHHRREARARGRAGPALVDLHQERRREDRRPKRLRARRQGSRNRRPPHAGRPPQIGVLRHQLLLREALNGVIDETFGDLVLVIHLGFIVFVALGALLALRWPRSLWIHAPAATWGILVELAGLGCPLTALEAHLRRSAGSAGY